MTESAAAEAVLEGTPSIRRRLVAMVYEALLLVGVLAATFLLPHIVIGMRTQRAASGAVLAAHVVLVLALYFVWLWRRSGQTLAMQTWRVRLVSADGCGRISIGQALLRYTLAWPSVLSGVGILWALIDRDRQFLHDRLAGTRLVLVPPVRKR